MKEENNQAKKARALGKKQKLEDLKATIIDYLVIGVICWWTIIMPIFCLYMARK